MPRRLGYSVDSVERALDVHLSNGRIRAWRCLGANRWSVTLTIGDDLALRSLREAYVFVCGVASCAQAMRDRS